MAVFSIGLVGAYMMLERANFLSASSQDEIIAYNLMRADIEEIKNMRDTNWVALRAWSGSDANDPTKHIESSKEYLLKETVTMVAWSDRNVLSLTESALGMNDSKLCREANTPRYGYCDSATYATPTKFRKVLKVETIWSDDGISSSMPDTLKITSIVSTEIPKRTYTLSTLITDWKR